MVTVADGAEVERGTAEWRMRRKIRRPSAPAAIPGLPGAGVGAIFKRRRGSFEQDTVLLPS